MHGRTCGEGVFGFIRGWAGIERVPPPPEPGPASDRPIFPSPRLTGAEWSSRRLLATSVGLRRRFAEQLSGEGSRGGCLTVLIGMF